jgi:hypothetical protein
VRSARPLVSARLQEVLQLWGKVKESPAFVVWFGARSSLGSSDALMRTRASQIGLIPDCQRADRGESGRGAIVHYLYMIVTGAVIVIRFFEVAPGRRGPSLPILSNTTSVGRVVSILVIARRFTVR